MIGRMTGPSCMVTRYMANKDHYFTLSDRRWRWRYSPLKGQADGWTIYAERKVLINSKLKGRARLETECHEALHAILGTEIVSEECVTSTAANLSKILWSLGYRLPPVAKNDA